MPCRHQPAPQGARQAIIGLGTVAVGQEDPYRPGRVGSSGRLRFRGWQLLLGWHWPRFVGGLQDGGEVGLETGGWGGQIGGEVCYWGLSCCEMRRGTRKRGFETLVRFGGGGEIE